MSIIAPVHPDHITVLTALSTASKGDILDIEAPRGELLDHTLEPSTTGFRKPSVREHIVRAFRGPNLATSGRITDSVQLAMASLALFLATDPTNSLRTRVKEICDTATATLKFAGTSKVALKALKFDPAEISRRTVAIERTLAHFTTLLAGVPTEIQKQVLAASHLQTTIDDAIRKLVRDISKAPAVNVHFPIQLLSAQIEHLLLAHALVALPERISLTELLRRVSVDDKSAIQVLIDGIRDCDPVLQASDRKEFLLQLGLKLKTCNERRGGDLFDAYLGSANRGRLFPRDPAPAAAAAAT
jgi:hypothetical protein